MSRHGELGCPSCLSSSICTACIDPGALLLRGTLWPPGSLWRLRTPCLSFPSSPLPWLCCQEVGLRHHYSGTHRLLSPTVSCPLAFLVLGNATPRRTFFFFLSKSLGPYITSINILSFTMSLGFWKVQSLHSIFRSLLLLSTLTYISPRATRGVQAICLNWKKEPGKIKQNKAEQPSRWLYAALEIMGYYYMALRATIWAVKLEENVYMR